MARALPRNAAFDPKRPLVPLNSFQRMPYTRR
jgi:hypothetical protein